MRRLAVSAIPALCALLSANVAHAQRGSDWMTSANDAQRSSWVRTDAKISPPSMQKPGFDLVWKKKPDNTARQLNNLTPPALLDFYIGYRGFRTLAFFGGSSDRVIAIDTDIARTEWEKSFSSGATPAGTLNCPGGMTSAVTRPTSTGYPPAAFGRGAGRGSGAKSGVGLPDQGAVTIRANDDPPPRRVPPPKPAADEGPSPYAPRIQYVLALSGDGKLHFLWISNGNEPDPAIPFLPPNANAQGLIAFGNYAYVSTINSCGGVADGVWALDLGTKKVNQWKAPDRGIVGSAGPAAGPDGTLYAASASALVALAPKTLNVTGTHKLSGAEFSSSPVVFDFKGKNIVAASTNDGRVHLFDAANLGGELGSSDPVGGHDFAAGALASWQDASGDRYVLAPVGAGGSAKGFRQNGDMKNGGVVAWKVVDNNGTPTLDPAWTSRDLTSPLTPIVVNGVVFAVSSGEFRPKDSKMTAAQRIQKSARAVLYALDGTTGKEVWNSGDQMTSFVHSGGLSAGGTRVYVSTFDGTQYAFGFPIEH